MDADNMNANSLPVVVGGRGETKNSTSAIMKGAFEALSIKDRSTGSDMGASKALEVLSCECSKETEESCPCCGKKATLLCTRCRAEKYCSRDCQKEHWTSGEHKRNCKPLDGRLILVELEHGSTFQEPVLVSPEADVLPREAPLGLFALKIQVSLSTAFAPMVCYDEGRSFHNLIHPQNCRKAKFLDRTIREYGDAGGAKAYFNVTVKDGKLVIYLDQRLGNLEW